MYISGINYESLVDGEGVRTIIFISGCKWNCKGCQNKDTHSFTNGREFTKEFQQEIINNIKSNPLIKGITLSGGDPMFSANDALNFINSLKLEIPHINIWCYTGYTIEELLKSNDIRFELLKQCDVLVDGTFEIDKRDVTLQFRGSYNQRLIDIKETLLKDQIVLYKMEDLHIEN